LGGLTTIIRSTIILALLSFLTLAAPPVEAEVRMGLDIGLAGKAGTLNTKQPIIAPALWFETDQLRNFRIELEYLTFPVDYGFRKVHYQRTTGWLLRRAGFEVFKKRFNLASGVGWSYLDRSDGSDRGALGFRAGLDYPFHFLGGRLFEAGFRYTGTPWAGSGAVEDRIELSFSAFLFGKPMESNSVP